MSAWTDDTDSFDHTVSFDPTGSPDHVGTHRGVATYARAGAGRAVVTVGPAPVPQSDHGETPGWDEYLTALETAVLAVDTAVMNGGLPGWPTVAAPPAGGMPDRLRIRAQVLLALLHDVTERTQLQHDDVAAELAALAPPRPIDHAHAAFLGGNLDVLT